MPYDEVMHKFKGGKLHSGSKKGPTVTNRKQAVAIMLSEKREAAKGKKEYKSVKKYQAGGFVAPNDDDTPTMTSYNPAYDKMPTSKNIEDRRKSDPTAGGEVDLGIVGRDIEWKNPEHTQVKEYVSPEGKAYADKHYSNLPTTPIAQAKGGPVTKHSDKPSWRRW